MFPYLGDVEQTGREAQDDVVGHAKAFGGLKSDDLALHEMAHLHRQLPPYKLRAGSTCLACLVASRIVSGFRNLWRAEFLYSGRQWWPGSGTGAQLRRLASFSEFGITKTAPCQICQ